jgi:hypothetical protein
MWPYDAAYVALAEFLDAELLTLDGKIAAVPGVQCVVRNLRVPPRPSRPTGTGGSTRSPRLPRPRRTAPLTPRLPIHKMV